MYIYSFMFQNFVHIIPIWIGTECRTSLYVRHGNVVRHVDTGPQHYTFFPSRGHAYLTKLKILPTSPFGQKWKLKDTSFKFPLYLSR